MEPDCFVQCLISFWASSSRRSDHWWMVFPVWSHGCSSAGDGNTSHLDAPVPLPSGFELASVRLAHYILTCFRNVLANLRRSSLFINYIDWVWSNVYCCRICDSKHTIGLPLSLIIKPYMHLIPKPTLAQPEHFLWFVSFVERAIELAEEFYNIRVYWLSENLLEV